MPPDPTTRNPADENHCILIQRVPQKGKRGKGEPVSIKTGLGTIKVLHVSDSKEKPVQIDSRTKSKEVKNCVLLERKL